jgi:alkaline phosphatase
MKKTYYIGLSLLVVILAGTRLPQLRKGPGKPKNIIFLIGDGMGLSQVTSGMVQNGGTLNLEAFKHIGLIKTHSADDFVTDSGAGATAFAIGKKTFNGAIGVDENGNAQLTILEMAEKKGLATGMIATCSMTHATPGSFIAHQKSRYLEEEIAAEYLNTDIDLIIGGGRRFFSSRKDGRNLVALMTANGYQVKETLAEVKEVKEGKLAAFLADNHMNSMIEGRGDYLPQASDVAFRLLSKNEKGFFLMIEGSQIDWGGHNNDTRYIMTEMQDFDNAIGRALEFARKDGNTLVVVTADHETGGFALKEGSYKDRTVVGSFTSKEHTGVMVPVFAYGPGAEEFMGIYENTAIFDKFKSLLGL